MAILVTGAAGFIGYHTARALLARGEAVVGVDNLDPYYDVQLKRDRLARLVDQPGFTFLEADLSEHEAVQALLHGLDIDRIVHLAAQAGVRHSIERPFAYAKANLTGHLSILEIARGLGPALRHLVYASSSSVYGANAKAPSSVADRVDNPISLYAATKKADELMSHTYAHLYRLPTTGLRFFTVYGPWGRPDMAMWLFTEAILAGRPIRVFNNGDMRRDFTFVDDIVSGVLAVLDRPPPVVDGAVPHVLHNIGNNHPEALMDMIALLEQALGRTAIKQFEPLQPGDVKASFADIDTLHAATGFRPTTPLSVGVRRFVDWYLDYKGLAAPAA
ncbi:NAD-dependent epimerase/dehydratase family protein [Zavarzinia sp. CC-PAN008]|uniref:NAD-dependent epimerase/dehydratase family protein n=1 Tax=Zavarzinia sp. CC-PAN008 TaxID=3243332 RepID=UPI003F7487F8